MNPIANLGKNCAMVPIRRAEEFVLSGVGIIPYFVGDTTVFQKKIESAFPPGVPTDLKAIRAYPQTKFVMTIEKGGRTEVFMPEKRVARTAAVWTLPFIDLTRFGNVMNFVRRQEIPHFDPEKELALTGPGLQAYFTGHTTVMLARVSAVFPSGIPGKPAEILVYPKLKFRVSVPSDKGKQTFTVQKRLTGKGAGAAWALPLEEWQRFGRLVGLVEKKEIPPFNPAHEFTLTDQGLGTHFVGCGGTLQSEVQRLFPPDVPCQSGEIYLFSESQFQWVLEREETTSTFTPQRRLVGGGKAVWVLPLSEKEQFAKALGRLVAVPTREISNEEVLLSGSELQKHFVGGSKKLCRIVHAHLTQSGFPVVEDSIRAYPKDQIECSINGETFTFTRGIRGERCAWGIKKIDLPRFGKACQFAKKQELTKFDETVVVLSQPGLERHFVNGKRKIGAVRNALIASGLPVKEDEIRAYPRNEAKLIVGLQAIPLSRGLSVTRCVWGVPPEEKLRFAYSFHLSDKTEIPELTDSLVAFSVSGMQEHFVGNPGDLMGIARDVFTRSGIPVDETQIRKYPCETAKITIGRRKFTLVRGLKNTRCVWGLPLDEKGRFAAATGISVRETQLVQLSEDEIPLNRIALNRHFVGSPQSIRQRLEFHLRGDTEPEIFESEENS